MAFTKLSVDDAAKQYWELLFAEFGKDLCRDIPRRIKAALHTGKKVASLDESALILPVAHAKDGDSLLIEGIYKDAHVRLMFHADIDKSGSVKNLNSFEIR